MARATGGEVILELMATVAELKVSAKEQATEMGALSERMTALSESMTAWSESMSSMSTRREDDVALFKKLAKLIGTYAKITDEKFDEVDDRLDRLEHASGK